MTPATGVASGVAACPFPGETESGDRALVRAIGDVVLVAVVDALGHGPLAAGVAKAAMDALEGASAASVETLVGDCHAALTGSRGAALTLAVFDLPGARLSWLSVGGVHGVLYRGHDDGTVETSHVPAWPGIVGYSLPRARVDRFELSPGDTLVLATDGIDSAFAHHGRAGPPSQAMRREPVQVLADRILAEHLRGHDDALVVVARYLGSDG